MLIGLLSLLLAHEALAETLRAERLASGLSRPVAIAAPPGDAQRLFIAEQHTGNIRILELETLTLRAEPFLSIPGLAQGNEQGLLGLAFDPEYASNGFVYVNLTRLGGETEVRRYQVSADPDMAAEDYTLVLRIAQPQLNHNGGWIGFGPLDGYLYIASGDGGSSNDEDFGHTTDTGNAQDITDNLLGKILRIDVDGDDFPVDPERNYSIPTTNPFWGQPGDDEIWAYGLRNPFRCGFDSLTGALYCGDVGQNQREEIDYQPPTSAGGINYGWRLREGMISTPSVGGPAPAGALNPIFDYPHSGEAISGNVVTGGAVYRGPVESLQGTYFFSDFSTARIWSFRFDGSDPADFNGGNVIEFVDWNAQPGFLPQQGTVASVATFGSDADGNLYFTNLFGGELFSIAMDSDDDGWTDPRDSCPAFANLDQRDTDGNGIGDACECGDQDGSGSVDLDDLLAIHAALYDPSRVTELCDTNEDGRCDVVDVIGANAKIFGAPAYCSRYPSP
jgi:glucose/arabinose dehydrogenase